MQCVNDWVVRGNTLNGNYILGIIFKLIDEKKKQGNSMIL